jgi:hypothetical protein
MHQPLLLLPAVIAGRAFADFQQQHAIHDDAVRFVGIGAHAFNAQVVVEFALIVLAALPSAMHQGQIVRLFAAVKRAVVLELTRLAAAGADTAFGHKQIQRIGIGAETKFRQIHGEGLAILGDGLQQIPAGIFHQIEHMLEAAVAAIVGVGHFGSSKRWQ